MKIFKKQKGYSLTYKGLEILCNTSLVLNILIILGFLAGALRFN